MRASVPIGVVVLSLAVASRGSAQTDFVQHERTMVPATSRFEVLQATLTVRSTFRLDKHTGTVDQLVMTKDSALTWQRVERLTHPSGDPQTPAAINYQLFLSGITVRSTYLLNVNNGVTWQLVRTKDDVLVWEPIE